MEISSLSILLFFLLTQVPHNHESTQPQPQLGFSSSTAVSQTRRDPKSYYLLTFGGEVLFLTHGKSKTKKMYNMATPTSLQPFGIILCTRRHHCRFIAPIPPRPTRFRCYIFFIIYFFSQVHTEQYTMYPG